MKGLAVLLALLLLINVASAFTLEATQANFWQEADITFWQTLPFAALWGHFIDQQISTNLKLAGAPHWEIIVACSVAVSTANAILQAKQVVNNARTGDHH